MMTMLAGRLSLLTAAGAGAGHAPDDTGGVPESWRATSSSASSARSSRSPARPSARSTRTRWCSRSKCAAQFNVATVPEADLAALIALYGEAAQPALAKAALDRGLSSKTLSAKSSRRGAVAGGDLRTA